MKRINWALIILLLLIGTGCKKHKREYFPKDMERVEVQIQRFDESLVSISRDSSAQAVRPLYTQYPEFMPYFLEEILSLPAEDTLEVSKALAMFLGDTVYHSSEVNADAIRTFKDIQNIQDQLNEAFTRIHYLYPEWTIPTCYFYLSGLSGIYNPQRYFSYDLSLCAIETDLYLGEDYKYYDITSNSSYTHKTMYKERVPLDIVLDYLSLSLIYEGKKSRLLDLMIHRGKILYLCQQLFPTREAYEVMGYTQEQWNWCVENEAKIWNTIMDKGDLFRTEHLLLTSYLNDGPFTSEISMDSPGRLGTWVGWQIVDNYMENHPEESLQDLMSNHDAQQILSNSNYQPQKK